MEARIIKSWILAFLALAVALPAHAGEASIAPSSACGKDARKAAEWLVIERIDNGKYNRHPTTPGEQACVLWLMQRLDGNGAWVVVKNGAGDPNVNRFVLAPLLDYFFIMQQSGRRLPPAYLSKLKLAVSLQYRAYQGAVTWDGAALSGGKYVNQDVYYALIMVLAGKLFHDPAYLAEAKKTVSGIEGNLLPSGAFHYIGRENESPLYHALVQVILARYYQITSDPLAESLLKRSSRYWLMSMTQDGLAEAWSDVWWKQSWMPMPLSALRISSSFTNDGRLVAFYKALKERYSSKIDSFEYWDAYASFWPVSKAAPVEMPVRWFLQDKDIRGVRARADNWYFGMTQGRGLRNTFVGGVMTNGNGAVDAAFRGAQIEVLSPGARGRHGLWLSEPEDNTALSYSADSAALRVSYVMQPSQINGYPYPEKADSSWQASQLWVMTKDALIGAVTLTSLTANPASLIQGRLLLGPCRPVRIAPAEWGCGGLRMHFYASFSSAADISIIPSENFSAASKWMGLSFSRKLDEVREGGAYTYIVWVGPDSVEAPTEVVLTDDRRQLNITWAGNRKMSVTYDEATKSVGVVR